MKLRFKLIALFITGIMTTIQAQDNPILLFPTGAPGENLQLTEKADNTGNQTGDLPVTRISDVSAPTITIYQAPEEYANGAAMIVCPGGGYNILAYDLEGVEVAHWLNELGITAIVLKYRVPRREGLEKHAAPLQDAQRAVGYIRANAEKYNIDPVRIGIMGFSAGAHLSVMTSNSGNERTYPIVDAADQVSCRPDFCLLVYPAYLDGENFSLAPEIKVSADAPPTCIIQTEDDKNYINSSLFYYYALKEAGVQAAMHLYPTGGHGYGLRDTGHLVNEWPDRAEDWMRDLGVID
ncbi:MAG: alpha/beta hydrolase [Tannerellaceae bacterium]|nr:alpha/beta hydrolase [Tannerellaceae bacterium]